MFATVATQTARNSRAIGGGADSWANRRGDAMMAHAPSIETSVERMVEAMRSHGPRSTSFLSRPENQRPAPIRRLIVLRRRRRSAGIVLGCRVLEPVHLREVRW